MSDYETLAVICKDPKDVENLMEKYGEDYKVDPYFYTTEKEAIGYVEFRANLIIKGNTEDLSKLEDKNSDEAEYLRSGIESMERYLNWSDREKLDKYKDMYTFELIEDGKGNLFTTDNPDPRWREYEILSEDPLKVSEINKINFTTNAILLPDGSWYDARVKKYLGMFADDESRIEFKKKYFKILDTEKYADYYCVLVKFEPTVRIRVEE